VTARERNKKQAGAVDNMLTTGDVARIFNMHASSIRRWSEQGILKSYRIGPRGDRRFRREDVAICYLDRAIKTYLKHLSALPIAVNAWDYKPIKAD
jgi:excisionase family DNA binding protein